MTTKRTGRPSKLTPDLMAKVLDALRAGNYIETACAYAGIGTTTYYRWMEQAEDDKADDIYREFRDAVAQARAESEVRNVALVQRAANEGTWQASAWFLERSYPRRWGRHDRHEVTGADGGPVAVAVNTEELESRIDSLMRQRKGSSDASGPVVVE